MFSDHATTFAGKPVVEFVPGETQLNAAEIPALRVNWDDQHTCMQLLMALLEQPNADQVSGLVIGAWAGEELFERNPSELIEALVAAAPQLPGVKGIFVGDIMSEENEVSWIQQCDLSPLLTTFDRLEVLKIRGSVGLSLGDKPTHDSLKMLTIECGGLPVTVLQEITRASFPALEHLELYLGTDYYGWDGSVDDVKNLLVGQKFPKLKYLGLRDSDIADAVAAVVANATILQQLDELDLSLGTLSDAGGQALLNSPAISRLKKLNLGHSYFSDEMSQQLAALPPEVDLSDPQGPGTEDDRYVAVGE